MGHSEVVHSCFKIQARVAFARVQGAGKREGELADETMVSNAEVPELQCEPDEVSNEVGGMGAAVDEDSAVDEWVVSRGE